MLFRSVQLIGQAQGLIHDVPTCAVLMQRLIAEADNAQQQVQSALLRPSLQEQSHAR